MNNGRKGGHFKFDQVNFFQDASSSEISHVKVNNGRLSAILNFDKMIFFKIHPLLKPYNLFYSNGVDILSGFHDIPQYQACRGE